MDESKKKYAYLGKKVILNVPSRDSDRSRIKIPR